MIRAQALPWNTGVSLALFDGQQRGVKVTAVETIEDTSLLIPPFANLSMDEAQTLLNDLWQVGLRPSDGVGSVGELRATQAHLKDVRLMLGQKIKLELK